MAEIIVGPSGEVQKALLSLKGGDTLLMEEGEYLGGLYTPNISGTVNSRITVKARVPGTVLIKGATSLKKDNFALSKCQYWTVDGLRFTDSLRTGVYGTGCHGLEIKNCESWEHPTQGMLISTSNFVLVEDCELHDIDEQHNLYISGGVIGVVIRRVKAYKAARANIQINNQGATSKARNCKIENCDLWRGGLDLAAAAINLIGVEDSEVVNTDIHACLAGGISLSGGSNRVKMLDNMISFRAGEGRQCIVATDINSAVHYAERNTCRMGKSTVSAIQAFKAAQIIQKDNVILAVAGKSIPVPDDVVSQPV